MSNRQQGAGSGQELPYQLRARRRNKNKHDFTGSTKDRLIAQFHRQIFKPGAQCLPRAVVLDPFWRADREGLCGK